MININIDRESIEWNKMWVALSKIEINLGLEDPFTADNDGERWQYMSSEIKFGKVIHHFRHRMHPKTNDREIYEVDGSIGLIN